MSDTPTCVWTGKSGTKYTYYIYSNDQGFNHAPGNYIFAKKTSPTTYTAIYIGETEDLGDRIPNHNERPCVSSHGGTRIHTHVNNGGQAARREEEQDLLANNDPPCNG